MLAVAQALLEPRAVECCRELVDQHFQELDIVGGEPGLCRRGKSNRPEQVTMREHRQHRPGPGVRRDTPSCCRIVLAWMMAVQNQGRACLRHPPAQVLAKTDARDGGLLGLSEAACRNQSKNARLVVVGAMVEISVRSELPRDCWQCVLQLLLWRIPEHKAGGDTIEQHQAPSGLVHDPTLQLRRAMTECSITSGGRRRSRAW